MSVGADLDARNAQVADQVMIYSDMRRPGLGLRVQRYALEELRRAGVRRAVMSEPAGSRLGSMYRRLGAMPGSQLYVMEL
jgi:hypothetical protein